jgi:maleate cis-trans isomerase
MYGHRARIGYTCPPRVTEVFPYEFYKMAPPGVTLALTSLLIYDHTLEEMQRSLTMSIEAARDMAKAGVNMVILGGGPILTSEGKGYGRIPELIAQTEKEIGIPVSTSITIYGEAMKTLGAKKVGTIGYGEPNPGGESYLSEYGIELVDSRGACAPFVDVAKLSSDISLNFARELKRLHPEIDTINLGAPHWATIENIEPLEKELGINVVTGGQMIMWAGLRRCGITDSIKGYGRLLSDF